MPVAVVTGGASGFGLALAERCAALGMDVAVLDLDGARSVAEAARVAAAQPVQTLGLAVDVSDAASVDAAATAVEERFGAVDLVVSNVGVQLFGAVEAFRDEEWRWLLDVNVIGSARVARAFLPLLRKAERGRLAFTTSSSVLDPASRLGAYQASKFAGVGPRRDPPTRGRRRRNRRHGDLPVRHDHPPPRDERGGAAESSASSDRLRG